MTKKNQKVGHESSPYDSRIIFWSQTTKQAKIKAIIHWKSCYSSPWEFIWDLGMSSLTIKPFFELDLLCELFDPIHQASMSRFYCAWVVWSTIMLHLQWFLKLESSRLSSYLVHSLWYLSKSFCFWMPQSCPAMRSKPVPDLMLSLLPRSLLGPSKSNW